MKTYLSSDDEIYCSGCWMRVDENGELEQYGDIDGDLHCVGLPVEQDDNGYYVRHD